MNITVFIRLSRILLTSALLGLLAGLALAACANGTPEIEIILPDTPTPAPTQPAPSPAAVSLASPTPSVIPTLQPALTPVPTPLLQPTPTVSPLAPNLNDWASVLVRNEKQRGFTRTFEIQVINLAQAPSPPSTLFLFDGLPEKGGTRFAEIEIPSIAPGESYEVQAPWNVRGKAGEHHIIRLVCPVGIEPSPARCQADGYTTYVLYLGAGIEISGEREVIRFPKGRQGQFFRRGDQVPITVHAANLTLTQTLSLTISTGIHGTGGEPEIFDPEVVTLLPGELFKRGYFYDSTSIRRRLPRVEFEITGSTTFNEVEYFYFYADAYFIAEPLSGTVPLIVTFIDHSMPLRSIENWLWDFGDGLTSTLQSPIHTYTAPGLYTVILTTTVPSRRIYWVDSLMTEGITTTGRITNPLLIPPVFTFTFSRTNYIEVLP